MNNSVELRTKILKEVEGERSRQIDAKGYTIEVDTLGRAGRLAAAGASYAIHAAYVLFKGEVLEGVPEWWPFHGESWKPRNPRRNLIKAMSLILAEVEKMDREVTSAEVKPEAPKDPA